MTPSWKKKREKKTYFEKKNKHIEMSFIQLNKKKTTTKKSRVGPKSYEMSFCPLRTLLTLKG